MDDAGRGAPAPCPCPSGSSSSEWTTGASILRPSCGIGAAEKTGSDARALGFVPLATPGLLRKDGCIVHDSCLTLSQRARIHSFRVTSSSNIRWYVRSLVLMDRAKVPNFLTSEDFPVSVGSEG